MAMEIERKFLVRGDFKQYAIKQNRITQGYICATSERTVRVRIKGEKGFLTIKGKTNESGTSRYEWEKEITLADAEDLLKLCEPGIIDKTRFYIPAGNFTFEVDEFYGENLGLVMAEIELSAEDDCFEKPSWLGEEVTGDKRYYNSMLMKNPFSKW
jgi:adenylate cyclase